MTRARAAAELLLRAFVGAAGLGACGGGDELPGRSDAAGDGAPWFEERAADAGIDFVHRSGHAGAYYTPEVMCGGVALLDADADGDLDVYFVQSGSLVAPPAERPGNRLYANRGDATFADVTVGSGADDRGYGIGVATGDADNDGGTDLYVTNVGPNVLLRSRRDGTFADVTEASGTGHPGFGSSAAFLDYDRDGDLDLYVANYLVWSVETEKECFNSLGRRDYCAPRHYNAPAVDVLYRNAGDGTFTDVTAAAGITAAFGTGLGVVCGDFTNDGLVDVFVANDGRVNQLWVSSGDGRFQDRALLFGCAMDADGIAKAGMGVSAADVDDDGDLDLVVVNLRGEADSFYRNEGTHFSDATAALGLGATGRSFTRFGTGLVDFDNDGRLDLYQANGRVASEADGHGTADPLAEPNLLYRGSAAGFAEVRPRGGTSALLVHTSRAAAFGDLDGDGGIDVVVANRDAPPYLLLNRVPARGHWLAVRALDEHGRDALGATVTLTLGERRLRRDVRTAWSYCAASDPRVHFGLGEHTAVDRLEVRWPDGVREEAPVPGIDRVVVLRRRAPRAETRPGVAQEER